MEFDRNGLEVLDRPECLRLLATAKLGRLALSSGALPVILPVNFLFDENRILIRTSRGTKLEAAVANSVVAFEVDDIEPLSHSGWSVSVTGFAREVTSPIDLERIHALPLAHWSGGDGHVIAISIEVVTGRRIRADHSLSETQ